MSKLMLIPSNLNINGIIDYADAFLFGLDDMCVNMPFKVTIDELEKVNNLLIEHNKELFVSMNKNFYSSELDNIKENLLKLEKLNISGIFYADTCFINLKKELNLKTPLIWSQEHLTTNYETINFWGEYGVDGAYLSAEITLKEIEEIRKNTELKLFVPIFGYFPIFTSKRHAVKNYLDNFKLKDSSKINYIEKENKTYPIVDDKEGSTVYSSNILDGYLEYLNLDVDYVSLNSFLIDDEVFKIISKAFKEKKEINIEEMLKNVDKGFLYKETVYKVKNYE